MPYFSVSWANMARLSNGEKLFEVSGELVTATARDFNEPDLIPVHPTGALVMSTLVVSDCYSMGDVGAVGTAIEQVPFFIPQPWNGPFRLLDLDWNARRALLEVLIGKSTVGVFLPGRGFGQHPVGITLPTITRLNKQLRTESLLVAINQTTFEIHSGPGNAQFQAWLAGVDLTSLVGDITDNVQNGFDAVRRLSFLYFSRFPHHLPHITSNNDVNLMTRCRNLREIKLHFHFQEVFRKDDFTVEKPAEQLVREYYLEGILDLKKLTKLEFFGWCSENQTRGIIGLAKWFEARFEKQHEEGERLKMVEVTWPGKLSSTEEEDN